MSASQAAAGHGHPHRIGGDAAHGNAGLLYKRIIVGYGFWLFLLSDIIMFSAFFATNAVLSGATNGGPTAGPLLYTPSVAPGGVELCLWDGEPCGGRTQPDVDSAGAARHRGAGRRIPRSGSEGVREP